MTDAHEVLIDHHRLLRTMMRRFDQLLSAPVQDRRQLLNTLSAEMQITSRSKTNCTTRRSAT